MDYFSLRPKYVVAGHADPKGGSWATGSKLEDCRP